MQGFPGAFFVFFEAQVDLLGNINKDVAIATQMHEHGRCREHSKEKKKRRWRTERCWSCIGPPVNYRRRTEQTTRETRRSKRELTRT